MTGPAHLWYVAYGSNLAARRFQYYVRGGLPAGASRPYAGCRDPSDPVRVVSLLVPGGLVFAGSSGTWGGGTATFDPGAGGTVACRAYLVTVEQLADVVAQETRRPPGGDVAVTLAAALPELSTAYVLGPGRYETVLRLGCRDGAPLLTVTAAQVGSLPVAAPSEGYLRWVAHGLNEAHGWPSARVAAYLASAPGARGVWTPEAVATLLSQGPP